MKTISVGELRQNPTAALGEVEQGETYVITRHRREIGRLVPPQRARQVTGADVMKIFGSTPVDEDWGRELAEARADLDDEKDPWEAGS